MPRYIDAEELLAWYDDFRRREREVLSENYHKERKDEARTKISILDKVYFKVQELEDKTADVEEVKHGEWKEIIDEKADLFFRQKFYCSACGEWNTYGKTEYCPICGARMDGKNGKD